MNKNDFINNIIWEKIESFKEIINDNSIPFDYHSFFTEYISYFENKLKIVIPELINDSEMQPLLTEFDNSISQLNNFISNNNSGHLKTSQSHIYAVLQRIRVFPTPITKSSYNFSRTINTFKEDFKNKANYLENLNLELLEKNTSLNEIISERENQLFSLGESIEIKSNDISNLVNTFNKDYENIKTTYINKINDLTKQENENFNQRLESFNKKYDENKIELIKRAEESISLIEDKLNEANRLVGLVANSAVTGKYKIIADENKTSADRWRLVASLLMTILSGLLIYAIWDISSKDFDWKKSLIRIIATAALSYPATYAASESKKHRNLEIRNRQIELELASINPFIEIMDNEKRKEIKANLVEKYFGNNHNEHIEKSDKNTNISLTLIERVIKSLLPIIKD